VKPANVMMISDGTAKVTDFGLAKARAVGGEQSVSAEQSILVSSGGMTPAYCSPEQATGEKLTRRTDIWSWAVSVLEMFTGEVTWPSGTVAPVHLQALRRGVADDQVVPRVPERVAVLLEHCFQEKADSRPKDMSVIADDLQAIYCHTTGATYPREIPKAAEALADNLNNRAASLMDLGKNDAAQKVWEEALRLDASHPESTYNFGLLKWRSAVITDEKLIIELKAIHNASWLPNYLLALVQCERGDHESALKLLKAVAVPEQLAAHVDLLLRSARKHTPRGRVCLATFKPKDRGLLGPTCVGLTPDGRHVVAGFSSAVNTPGQVMAWNVATGECLWRSKEHADSVRSLSMSSDGQLVLTASDDGTLKLCEVRTGKAVRTIKTERRHRTWRSVSLGSGSRYVLCGGTTVLEIWDLFSGECVRDFEELESSESINSVALSGDGRYALSGGGAEDTQTASLRLWDTSDRGCIRVYEGMEDNILAACFTPDGRFILAAGRDHSMQVWDVNSSRPVGAFVGHTQAVCSLCVSPDMRYVVSGSGDHSRHVGRVTIWEFATRRCLCTLEGHARQVLAVAAHEPLAVSASADGTIKLWSLAWNCRAPQILSRSRNVHTASATTDNYHQALATARVAANRGDWVSAASAIRDARAQDGCDTRPEVLAEWRKLYIRLPKDSLRNAWPVASFSPPPAEGQSVILTDDGQHALSIGLDGLKLWDIVSGKCTNKAECEFWSELKAASICADGSHVIFTMGKCFVWPLKRRDVVPMGNSISVIGLGGDGLYALTGSGKYIFEAEELRQLLLLWETETGRCLRSFEGHSRSITAACLSADGRYGLSASHDRTVRLWEVSSGRCLRTWQGDFEQWVDCIKFSPDCEFFLAADTSGRILRFPIGSEHPSLTLSGHRSQVFCLGFSCDARYAVSGGGEEDVTAHPNPDYTIRLWDFRSGECLRVFDGHESNVQVVCFSSDGQYLISSGADRSILSWHLDWELEDRAPSEWDESARGYLRAFLTLHTPYASKLPQRRQPTEAEIALALTRRGKPIWTEKDFQQLLANLGCAGYGWLRPDGVRRELEKMTANWKGPPPLTGWSSEWERRENGDATKTAKGHEFSDQ